MTDSPATPGRRIFRARPARWFLLLLLPVVSSWAQGIPKHGYAILNLTSQKLHLSVWSGTNVLTKMEDGDALDLGAYTGLLPCITPAPSLRLEMRGRGPLEIKQPFAKLGDTPVFVLLEKKNQPLEVMVIRNATDRSPSFYDAINLSSLPSLKIRANKKEWNLSWGTRTRLTSEKALTFSLPQGPEKALESQEDDNFLLIFFTDGNGQIQYKVTRDNLL